MPLGFIPSPTKDLAMRKRLSVANSIAVAELEKAEKARRRRQLSLRIQLIHDETDRMRAEAADRQRSVDSKASFLAVAAGVVIAAAAASDWNQPWLIAILPMSFSALGLAFAAIALRPGTRDDITPQILYDRWADSEHSVGAVELDVLKKKIRAFTAREKVIRSRARATSVGFLFLLAGVISLAVVFALESV
jgi:hypothetical protein